jgi:hypothetical protein
MPVGTDRFAGRDAAGASAWYQGVLGKIIREPLVHFLAAGLAIFLIGQHFSATSAAARIVVTKEQVAKIGEAYRREFGAAPTPDVMAALVEKYIDEEALYRAGVALNFNRDDEIVRRRVIQKMQFLQQDLRPPAEPTAAQISEYFAAHRAHYIQPERVTFEHVFFSPDRDGDANARHRAEVALSRMANADAPAPTGDPFPDLRDFTNFDATQARRLFGETPIVQALFEAPTGRWSGPYQSAYGWHLVYVHAKQPAETPELSAVQEQVRTDLLADERARANRAALNALRARYTVIREDLK